MQQYGMLGVLRQPGVLTITPDALRFAPHASPIGVLPDPPPWELRRESAGPLRLVRGYTLARLFEWNDRHQRWDLLFSSADTRWWVQDLVDAGWEFDECRASQRRNRWRPPER